MLGRFLASAGIALVVFVLTVVGVTLAGSADVQSEMGAGGLEVLFAFTSGIAAGLVTSALAFIVTMVAWPKKPRGTPRQD